MLFFDRVFRVSVLFLSGFSKKFDLVHQTVSPRERVGSGDETRRARTSSDLGNSCTSRETRYYTSYTFKYVI